jgi:GTPase SAR1 family protein
MGTLFVECSAKTNVGVVDIFQELVRKVSTCTTTSTLGILIRRYSIGQNYGREARRRTRSFR